MITNQLYVNKENCCGCGSCVNTCPKNAVSMVRDAEGFLYPEIDSGKCVDCGLCIKSCAFQNIKEPNKSLSVYAAVRKDREKLKQSASGGMFAVIAEKVIDEGGIVFGCSMEKKDGKLYPMHIKAENRDELASVLGSKYVQSDTGSIFKSIKKELASGRKVLFCGTPCQVAGLKGFLKKDRDNLILLDLICHGVPSSKMFQDYIECIEKKKNIKVENFRFRAKTGKTGLAGEMIYTDKNGNRKSTLMFPAISSYYSNFLKSHIYRASCYKCPYACENRPGDLTIGDFWGFAKHYNDFDKTQFIAADGISCVSVNTEKGNEIWESLKADIAVHNSDYVKAADRNPQLVRPSSKGEKYELIMKTYREKGYAGVEKLFAPALRKYKIKSSIKKLIPRFLINFLKK